MTNATLGEKLDAGNPHVWVDEGVARSGRFRWGMALAVCAGALMAEAGVTIRETVLDVSSPDEVSVSRFSYDGACTLCATQVQTRVRLGGAIFPGPKPFRGVSEIVLETPGVSNGNVRVNLVNRDTGEKKGYSAKWQERTVVRVDLDPRSWYQFGDVYFNPGKRPTPIAKLAVSAVWGTRPGTAAEAFAAESDTGNALHVAQDPAAVSVLLRNRAERTLFATGTVVAVHYSGERLTVPFAGDVPPSGVLRLPLGEALRKTSSPYGLWRVRTEVVSEGTRATPDETRFAVLQAHPVTPRLPPGQFRLGINVHFDLSSPAYPLYLDALQAVGCKLTRGGHFAFNRRWLKASDPEPDFTESDRLMADLKRLGISMNVGCWPNPPWSSPVPDGGYRKVIHTRPLKGTMGRYCEKLARHYGTDIDYIETSNEPDLWRPDEFPAADYVDYQKECYEGVKRGCPKIRVIPGGFTTADSSHPKILKKGFQETVLREAKGYYDAHPIHLHGAFGFYENAVLNDLFPMRAREGVTVPWFPNETGHTLVQGDEDRVAVSVWQKILFSQAHGACDYVWYNLRATRWAPKNAEGGYGLMTRDWYPRAAYASYSALASVLTGCAADGVVSELRGRHLYRYVRKNGRKGDVVFAGWDAWGERPVPLRIRSDASAVRVVDLMGNARPAERTADGRYVFPLASVPSAIVLEGAADAEIDPEDVRNVPLPKLDARTLPSAIEGRAPDFVLDKVTQATQLYEANPETEHRTWKGPKDLSARIWIGRTEDSLRIRFEVEDDLHVQRSPAQALYRNDGIQFVLEAPGQSGNFEFGIARAADGAPLKSLWIVPASFDAEKILASVRLDTAREGTLTTYDFAVPLKDIGFDAAILANGFRFNAIVYDDDGMGQDRDGWLEIMPGIAGSKQYGGCPCVRFARGDTGK